MINQKLCLNNCGNLAKPTGNFCSPKCRGRYWASIRAEYKTPYGKGFTDELRNLVRAREGFRCLLCNAPKGEKMRGPYLHVHHIDYVKTHNTDGNLCLLCMVCHGLVHKSKDAQLWAFWLKSILAMRGHIDFPGASIPVDVIAAHVKKVKAKYARRDIVF